MQFTASIISCLIVASLTLSHPIELEERKATKPACQKSQLCQPAAGSTLDKEFYFRYHGVSSTSAASKYLTMKLVPVPASESRINAGRPAEKMHSTSTSPSAFHWKEDGSTYMFEGKAGIPCDTIGEYNIHLNDHIEENGRNVTEKHTFGPYKVISETCQEATKPQA